VFGEFTFFKFSKYSKRIWHFPLSIELGITKVNKILKVTAKKNLRSENIPECDIGGLATVAR
jgi:hypothetical protein